MISREARIKSIYLSTARFSDADSSNPYREELQKLSEAIARGEPVQFDQSELVRLGSIADVVEQVSWTGVLRYLARLFLPAAIALTGLWLLVWLI